MSKQAWAGIAAGGWLILGTISIFLSTSDQGLAATGDAATPPPAAVPSITNTEWKKTCGGDGVCYVEQYALALPNKAPVLSARFDLQGGDKRGRVFFKAPLGVLLRDGVRFSIDSHDPIVMPYDRCDPTGCVAWAVLGEDTVDTFKKGKALTVTYVLPSADPKQQKPIAQPIPVSLTGLSAALMSLTK